MNDRRDPADSDAPIADEVIRCFVHLDTHQASPEHLQQLLQWAESDPDKLDQFEALAELWERLEDVEPAWLSQSDRIPRQPTTAPASAQRYDRKGLNQERPGQERPSQERPGQERPGQEKSGQQRLGGVKSGRLGLDQVRPGQARSAQASRSPTRRPERSPRRWWLPAGALAASLAALLTWSAMQLPARESSSYHTARGEVEQLTLADGSEIHMNGLTRLDVELKLRSRAVNLVRGEAFFQVAEDPNRQFIVDLSGASVRAVGTAFNIDKVADQARISIVEGVVEVSVEDPHSDLIRAEGGEEIELVWTRVDGERRLASLTRRTMDSNDQSLAWRSGMVHLEGESLRQALERINRQSDRLISIDDPRLAEQPVYGSFNLKNIDGFLEALEYMYPIERFENRNTIVLRYRRSAESSGQLP